MHLGFRIRAISLASAGLFVAVACGGGSNSTGGANPAPPDKQVFSVNINTEPSTLDPTQQQWVYEADLGRNTFEALTRAKADLSDVEGAAASSWDISSDGLTWTFHIRSGEKYSDGSPVTAGDFVYSYKRILDPTVAAPYTDPFFDQTIAGGANYGSIDAKDANAVATFLNGLGLSAPDDHTFVVKLQHPAPYFKWITSLWLAAPLKKSEVDAANGSFGAVSANAPSQVIGNGAFKISEVVPKDHITLVPNPYYRTQPKLQKVVLYEIADVNSEFAKYQNGELSMSLIPPADTQSVLNDPKLGKQVVKLPTLLTYWIDYNTTKAPLNNADLRMALSKSIDRQSYVTNILKGIGTPFTSMIPKGMPGYQPNLNDQSFDCSAAKADLAKAKTEGVTDAQLANLHYEYRNSPTRKTTAEFFQQQWQTCLGLNVVLDAKESKSVSKDLGTLNYMISGLSGWQADYPDGQDWFDIFITGSGNQFDGWSDKTYDSAVQTGDNAASNSDRYAAYAQAQKELVQQAPVTFMFQQEKFFLLSPKVQGLVNNALDDDWAGDVASSTTMYISQ